METVPIYKVRGEINASIIKDFLQSSGVPTYFGSIDDGKRKISFGATQMIYVDILNKEKALNLIREQGFTEDIDSCSNDTGDVSWKKLYAPPKSFFSWIYGIFRTVILKR
jgi:hypothetical protein